jgi:hypothetical protein
MARMTKENVRDWRIVTGKQLDNEVFHLCSSAQSINQSVATKSREEQHLQTVS